MEIIYGAEKKHSLQQDFLFLVTKLSLKEVENEDLTDHKSCLIQLWNMPTGVAASDPF